MSNSIPTPRQTFTLKYGQDKIEEMITYIANEMPTYKFINKNEALNSIRIEITRGFQPQHLDIRFQNNSDESTTSFEVEVSKHTGGMTDDDSNLYAKKNLDQLMDFLVRCLEGYKITEEDKKSAKNAQLLTIFFISLLVIAFIWWVGSGIWW
jgi:hypothetical protein